MLGATLPTNGAGYIQFISPEALQDVPVSTSTVHDILIPMYAGLYNVPTTTLDKVVSCESGYGEYQEGDHGTSFGLSQIHLPAHPDITKQQAYNPFFSLNYMASEISKGHGSMWTCYQKYFGSTDT